MKVRSVRRKDITVLSLVLARAFDTDPVLGWVARQGSGRISALTDLFAYCLEDSLKGGMSTCTEDLRACAVWYPPGDEEGRILDDFLMLPRILRWAGIGRTRRFISFIGEMREHRPREPFYYLDSIGVAPEAQGQGYGSALLTHTLAIVDSQGGTAYLESSNPRNNQLYERHGFRVISEAPLPRFGPNLWYMLRLRTPTAI